MLKKKNRIKYLGFDDVWFMLIGILILSFATDYLFSNSFARLPLGIALITWSVSLFFTICDWFIIRAIMIRLRKTYPGLKDSLPRIALLFLGIVATVVAVDYVGSKLLSQIIPGFNSQT